MESYSEIPLNNGQTAIVDASDFDWLNRWKWKAKYSIGSRSFYAFRTKSLRRTRDGKRKSVSLYMSREILRVPKDRVVDHINHNTLDNRRENLREATRSENLFNARVRSDNPVGLKGVKRYGKKWRSTITINGRRRYLGIFSTPREAHGAYVAAAKELHGEFACLTREMICA